jgi:hypothetical protein
VTSSRDIPRSFTPRSDREGDDKVLDASGRGYVPSSGRAEQTVMPLFSLTGLKTRLRERVDTAASGTDVPAGIERGSDPEAATGSRERGRMRRRLRELRRLREAQLLELGALVLEAHRHDRDDTPVIKHKAAEAAAIDNEARALAQALDTDAGLHTVVAAGIAGPCPTCGTLASTAARFCSTCGTALDGRPDAARPAPEPETHDEDPTQAVETSVKTNGTMPDEVEAAT